MENNVITLSEYEFGHGWTMTIDLEEVNKSAGSKYQKEGRMCASYPLSTARKLLRTIRRYGSEDDFLKCDKCFTGKLAEFWRKIR